MAFEISLFVLSSRNLDQIRSLIGVKLEKFGVGNVDERLLLMECFIASVIEKYNVFPTNNYPTAEKVVDLVAEQVIENHFLVYNNGSY